MKKVRVTIRDLDTGCTLRVRTRKPVGIGNDIAYGESLWRITGYGMEYDELVVNAFYKGGWKSLTKHRVTPVLGVDHGLQEEV